MRELIIFMLSVSGLSWIITKSLLFKTFREYVSIKHSVSKKYFWWFLNCILNCEGCFGVWAGALIYVLMYRSVDVYMVLFGFIGAIVSLIIIASHKFLSK